MNSEFRILPIILVHSHQVTFMLDLAQGLISWKAESKEESLCGTYRLQFSLESWRRPGHWSSSWDDSSGLRCVFFRI